MNRLSVISACMIFALAGCGQSNDATAPSNDTVTEAAAPTVAVALSGQAIFNRCAACHAVKAGAPNGNGPNLHNIVGAKIAAVPGYTYSNALKAKTGNWDKAALDGYLTSPAKYASGTKMVFAGLAKPEERAAVIDYLATLK
jgi:cytochrome c